MNNELRINSIESFSTKDGEGIRSVIFLQGCPLRCAYCHNPETWDIKGGEKITVTKLADKVLRFKEYWGNNGGVTLSGGEPLLQAKALLPLLTLLKSKGVDIAIDTSGAVMNDDVPKVISLCDHIILDLKFAGEAEYAKHTGGKLKTVLAFLDECGRQGKRIWIRIVIVPGLNDTEADIDKYAKILKNRKIEKTELIPFHTLGFDKYIKLGIANPLEGTKALSITRLRELQGRIESIAK